MMLIRKSFRLFWSAVLHDYHNQPGLFLARRLESPLIAVALFMVQANLFGDMSEQRFLLSWLGVVILSWTLKSILKVDEVSTIHNKISGMVDHAAFFAAQSRAMGLLIEFIVDLCIVAMLLVFVRGYSDVLVMFLTAILVVVTHGVLNFCLYPIHLHASRWMNVKNAMVVVFIFFVTMSPVFFTFDDLRPFGSKYFTSFNPASHFLAAYYNVFWFQVPVSMQVLPIVLAFAVVFIWFSMFISKPQRIRNDTEIPIEGLERNELVLGRFVGRGGLTGLELLYIFYALGSRPMREFPEKVDKLLRDQVFKSQLHRGMSTYSRANDFYLDLLLASCLAGSEEMVVHVPGDEIFNVTLDQLKAVLDQVNTIMGTRMSLSVQASSQVGSMS